MRSRRRWREQLVSAVQVIASGAVLVTVLGSGAGCDSPGGSTKTSCKTDDVCGGGACVDGICVAHSAGRTVAVEVTPSSTSLAATTERVGLTLAGLSLDLVADEEASIAGTVTSMVPFTKEAHVAIGIPSRIPGRSNLQIDAEMAMNQFGFTVPKGRVGMETTASFLFLPGMTTVQIQPPILLKASLTPSVNLVFPMTADLTFVRGRLVGADGNPLGGDAYQARVSFNGVPVSNLVAPDSTNGSFTLLVSSKTIPMAPDDLVQVTIGTADNPDNAPLLITKAISLATLGEPATPVGAARVYTMPTLLPPAPVTVRVTADGKGQSGVTVRLVTDDIPTADGGVAHYERKAVTAHGEATMLVIPGREGAPLLYRASIEAPTDDLFPYASQCVGDQLIAVGPSGEIADLEPFVLLPKLALSGSVSDATAAPVSGAYVTATQRGGANECSDSTPSRVVSTTTGANGTYLLLVEPGSYHLEVVPPASSAWPRVTKDLPSPVTHARVVPIQLPEGEVVKGNVFASDMYTVLPNASIKIFQVCCQSAPCDCTTEPIVLAETQADANGSYQAVLPVAAPSP